GAVSFSSALLYGTRARPLLLPRSPPAAADLGLAVEDGNNPPLELTSVSAVFAELPWIYFEAPETAIVARYGDVEAAAPRFDLEALRDAIDVSGLSEATWQPPRTLVESDAGAGAPALPSAGAAIDAAKFRHSRVIADAS